MLNSLNWNQSGRWHILVERYGVKVSPLCRLYVVLVACLAVEIILQMAPPTHPAPAWLLTVKPPTHYHTFIIRTETHTCTQTHSLSHVFWVLWYYSVATDSPWIHTMACMTTQACGGFHNTCENTIMCGLRHFASDGSRTVIFAWSGWLIVCYSVTIS